MKETLSKQHNILSQTADLIADSNVDFDPTTLGLEKYSTFKIVGVGKAAEALVQRIYQAYPRQIIDGLVIGHKDGMIGPNIQCFQGAHPYPNDETVAASYEVQQFVKEVAPHEHLVVCITGGASSMFTIPPFGIELEEIQKLYALLLQSGMNIHEMNTVRKHVCDVKGGKLLEVFQGASITTILDSDVPDHDQSTIGSGPTIVDTTSYIDAIQLLKQHEIWEEVPVCIQEHLICGVEGIIPENPKTMNAFSFKNTVHLINERDMSIASITQFLKKQGYITWVDSEPYEGSVMAVSKKICSRAIQVLSGNDLLKKPVALIFNGECTVNVKGDGKGGRNQELALMAALSVEGQHAISLLSVDTDGIDGPTEVSGAIINSFTTLEARKKKIEPERYLQNNDSYHFHKALNTHIQVGATGKNWMDVQVVLIE